ncbi:hypothetical protein CYMTET_48878 [Cymbomonas tetramitiformis]|uniref:Myosin motor domain-containing protein n=1 Tax=Cymbomonas tetramitiformis TaxID=36881 RepID=A0AAE0EV37_9CHLO|nr:hypothetical protein CYMTET_48878 [Cymbomonas tetramitiformis]
MNTVSVVNDLIELHDADDEAIMFNLAERFKADNYYTCVGPVLIAINPYKWLDIYGQKEIDNHFAQKVHDCPPHIYGTADAAYRSMLRNRQPQAIVISGESGAGKTEAAKLIMKYIFAASQLKANKLGKSCMMNTDEDGLTRRILATNTALEAFGNAKTTRNDNSSRFGKYTLLQFDYDGKPLGAKISHYLLEKTRVVAQAEGERNYHIFYQMLSGADSKQRTTLHLLPVEQYKYLSSGNCFTVQGVDDSKVWKETFESLEIIGLTPEQIQQVMMVMSAILLLGNVEFREKSDGYAELCEGAKELLSKIAGLLSVDSEYLEESLMLHSLQAGGKGVRRKSLENVSQAEALKVANTLPQAEESRNSLAKALYQKYFRWLISTMNEAMISDNYQASIGILDIYGFEIFDHNSLEQLCINYANEKLQHGFIKQVFVQEQEEYRREGIEWVDVDFKDNYGCVEVIEMKGVGILPALDEQCAMPRGTDGAWAQGLFQAHCGAKKHGYFTRPRMGEESFLLSHYAGKVAYEIKGCVNKNRDFLHHDALDMLHTSELALVQGMVEDLEVQVTARAKNTVSYHFRNNLHELMELLESSNRHYVRAIKPNLNKKAGEFDPKMILAQLAYNGVQETIRVRRSGYPFRYIFADFVQRYFMLMDKTERDGVEAVDLCPMLMDAGGVPRGKEIWQVGRTKIFIKSDVPIMQLEKAREVLVARHVLRIQVMWRGFKVREWFHALKAATIVVQKNAHRARCQRIYRRRRQGLIRLQAVQRMRVARAYFQRYRRATIACQAALKGRICRAAFLALVALRQQSASTLQRTLRGWLQRRRYLRLRVAFVKVHAGARGLVARRKYARMRRGFILLQAQQRMRSARAAYRREYANVVRCQAETRRLVERNRYKRARYVLTLVQACTRRLQALQRYRIMRRGFIRCQAQQRMRSARAAYRRDYANVVRCQAETRRLVERNRYKRVCYVLTLVQACTRRLQALQRYRIMRRGFIRCQVVYRGHLAAKRYREMIRPLQKYSRSRAEVNRYMVLAWGTAPPLSRKVACGAPLPAAEPPTQPALRKPAVRTPMVTGEAARHAEGVQLMLEVSAEGEVAATLTDATPAGVQVADAGAEIPPAGAGGQASCGGASFPVSTSTPEAGPTEEELARMRRMVRAERAEALQCASGVESQSLLKRKKHELEKRVAAAQRQLAETRQKAAAVVKTKEELKVKIAATKKSLEDAKTATAEARKNAPEQNALVMAEQAARTQQQVPGRRTSVKDLTKEIGQPRPRSLSKAPTIVIDGAVSKSRSLFEGGKPDSDSSPSSMTASSVTPADASLDAKAIATPEPAAATANVTPQPAAVTTLSEAASPANTEAASAAGTQDAGSAQEKPAGSKSRGIGDIRKQFESKQFESSSAPLKSTAPKGVAPKVGSVKAGGQPPTPPAESATAARQTVEASAAPRPPPSNSPTTGQSTTNVNGHGQQAQSPTAKQLSATTAPPEPATATVSIDKFPCVVSPRADDPPRRASSVSSPYPPSTPPPPPATPSKQPTDPFESSKTVSPLSDSSDHSDLSESAESPRRPRTSALFFSNPNKPVPIDDGGRRRSASTPHGGQVQRNSPASSTGSENGTSKEVKKKKSSLFGSFFGRK